MATVEELIRREEDGSISFGNHTLAEKAKVEDFSHEGDLYKVKTYQTMTKMEKNGMFAYESVPGTSVLFFTEREDGVSFVVEGSEDAQITIGLQDDTESDVRINWEAAGRMCTNLVGKLRPSVELAGAGLVKVAIRRWVGAEYDN